jgi:hypothetical protein
MELNEYQQRCNRQDGSIMYPSHGLGNEESTQYCILSLNGEAGEVAEKALETGLIQTSALGLCASSGQLANKFKKILRNDPGKTLEGERAALAKELGGALWYIAMCAMELGYGLDEIAIMNLNLIADRQARNTLQGDGDDR